MEELRHVDLLYQMNRNSISRSFLIHNFQGYLENYKFSANIKWLQIRIYFSLCYHYFIISKV